MEWYMCWSRLLSSLIVCSHPLKWLFWHFFSASFTFHAFDRDMDDVLFFDIHHWWWPPPFNNKTKSACEFHRSDSPLNVCKCAIPLYHSIIRRIYLKAGYRHIHNCLWHKVNQKNYQTLYALHFFWKKTFFFTPKSKLIFINSCKRRVQVE